MNTTLIIDEQGLERIARLVPPKNFRGIDIRNCNTCRWLNTDDSRNQCLRPDGPVYEAGSNDAWWNVCDYWERIK